jgi:7 transmembrane receptor (rhodopsin family)
MAVPFIQTAAVLIESMSLILIALDRFLAVRNKSNAKLLQSKLFCLSVILCAWMVGLGVSAPVLFGYEYIPALVIPDDEAASPIKGFVCVTDMVSLCKHTVLRIR